MEPNLEMFIHVTKTEPSGCYMTHWLHLGTTIRTETPLWSDVSLTVKNTLNFVNGETIYLTGIWSALSPTASKSWPN